MNRDEEAYDLQTNLVSVDSDIMRPVKLSKLESRKHKEQMDVEDGPNCFIGN